MHNGETINELTALVEQVEQRAQIQPPVFSWADDDDYEALLAERPGIEERYR